MKRLLALSFAASLALPSQASLLRLVPPAVSVIQGSAFDVRVLADIDADDEIIGFGFDLLASPTLRFTGFTPGAGFADDPVHLAPFSDGDGIRAASAGDLLTGPAISGLGLLLGTLHLVAQAEGPAMLSLGADDLAGNFSEGLIPLSILSQNFLPPVQDARLTILPNPVAEPASPLGWAMAWLAALFVRRQIVRRPAAIHDGAVRRTRAR